MAALLLGELLPAALRSVGVGLVASAEVVSSLSQTASAPAIEGALGRAGLFIIFAVVVFGTFVYSVGWKVKNFSIHIFFKKNLKAQRDCLAITCSFVFL